MTVEQTRAAFQIVMAVGEAIRDLGSVPSGHLYASVMGKLSLPAYNAVIDALVRAQCVRRDANHLLTWIGPAKQA